MELAFFLFHTKLILHELLQNLTNMGDMIRLVLGKNQNVIKIDKHKAVEEVSHYIIYHGLKNGRCVSEAKRHYQLLVSQKRVECRFPLISCFDPHQGDRCSTDPVFVKIVAG